MSWCLMDISLVGSSAAAPSSAWGLIFSAKAASLAGILLAIELSLVFALMSSERLLLKVLVKAMMEEVCFRCDECRLGVVLKC